MRTLKVGYWPLSENLLSAGDRRRIVFWAKARGHTIVTDLSQKVDVIVASEKTDFNARFFSTNQVPVIFDLVDAYLSPSGRIEDIARGFAKWKLGQITGSPSLFSSHIREFCKTSDAVICSSPEQAELISPLNRNTHVILDSHEEIPMLTPKTFAKNQKPLGILWEGQPATLSGIKQVSSSLYELQDFYNITLNFVTDDSYFKVLNSHFRGNTLDLIHKYLPGISGNVALSQWSVKNLIDTANKCGAAMLPIDISVPIQKLKPENRLLIMWRLGLPCLSSPSPAYRRVAKQSGVSSICNESGDWTKSFKTLFEDPDFAKKEVQKGQNYLKEFHNRDLLLAKWDHAIESVM
jgi:hypothetical protein